MTEVITVEMGSGAGRYWLVAVGSGGMTRVLATCGRPEQAEIVADAMRELSPERLADVEERLGCVAKRASSAETFARYVSGGIVRGVS